MDEARGNPGSMGRGEEGHAGPGAEWFEHADEAGSPGLRFSCTMCGNCCTGPEGYVLLTTLEAEALARRFGLPVAEFVATYTQMSVHGLSLTERITDAGRDCVFLDREKVPGRAVCGVYEDRPMQCRTWPFWNSNLASRYAWQRAKRVCPGMDQGQRYTPVEIRIERDKVDI
jgi:Fe-S-cluster containining protein